MKGGKEQEVSKLDIIGSKTASLIVGTKSPKEMMQLLSWCEKLGVLHIVKRKLEEEETFTGPWTPALEAKFEQIAEEIEAEFNDTSDSDNVS